MPELFTLRKRLVHARAHAPVDRGRPKIATVSEASRQDIARWLAVDPARIALLPGAAHPSCAPAPARPVARWPSATTCAGPTC
jgi:hypothetical protein